jgi:nucleotide-binding universal stress UspA family protein
VTVLCGTDFSEAASLAVDAAASIATKWKEELVIVHALELPGAEDAGTFSLLEAERRRAESALSQEAERAGVSGGRIRTECGIGSSDSALVSAAEAHAARLVVVGALGRRGGSLWNLGSTADRVAQTSKRPVLVVRDADSITAWTRGERALRILVAVDRSTSSDAAVRWASELEQIGPCDLTCAHVYWPPGVKKELDLAGGLPIGADHPEIEAVLSGQLEARIAPLRDGRSFKMRLLGGLGRLADHVAAMAESERADLVVVGANQLTLVSRLWHGSVSRGVIERASTNVVCVTGSDSV